MANLNGFDANHVKPASQFDPIPNGRYLAEITQSEMKPTKAGTGKYLELTFRLLNGPHKGRFLWARLNLENQNPTAVLIGKAELSAICHAVGVLVVHNSKELHNLPIQISVRCKRRDDTGDIVNEIVGYSKVQDQTASPSELPGISPAPFRQHVPGVWHPIAHQSAETPVRE